MKPQIQIGVPTSGVREDVNQLVQTSDMAAIGENCIYFDGTIRPRPALDVQVENDTSIGNWQQILSETITTDQLGMVGDVNVRSMIQANDGSYILASLTVEGAPGDTFAYSKDNGQTWVVSDLGWPEADHIVDYMIVAGGYLFTFGSTVDPMLPGSSIRKVFRTQADLLPLGSGVWEELYGNSDSGIFQFAGFHYDADEDSIVYIFFEYVFGEPTSVNLRSVQIPDATQASPGVAVLEESSYDWGDIGGLGDYGYNFLNHFWDGSDWIFSSYGKSDPIDVDSATERGIVAIPFGFESGGLVPHEEDSIFSPVWSIDLRESRVKINPLDLDVKAGYAYAPSPVVPVMLSDDAVGYLLLAPSGNTWDLNRQGVVSVPFDGVEFGTPSLVHTIKPSGSSAYTPTGSARTSEKVVFSYRATSSYTLPNLVVSSDHGATFMDFDAGDDEIAEAGFSGYNLYFNDDTDQHYFYANPVGGGATTAVIYLLPTSLGPSALGDVTTVYQTDMDDENGALFIGTTNAIARLDADTGQWYRITANQLECHPQTGNPPSVWTASGNIPPLSAGPDTDEYVSGVSIEGVYGQTPWIFRTFQMNGKVYVIGVNGQCYPIIYNEDMAGKFARRLGEVPVGDDNHVEGDPAKTPTGDLAPRARCLAVAYDRVLLGNNPTGSSSEVNVSANLDADRGYDGPGGQLIALGDTPGGIVSMNEISALQVAIYKEDAIYHAVAQGDILGVTAPFRFELSKIGVSGPVSALSVQQNFDGRHIYLARDGGVYMYDGVAPLDGGRNIRRMIQKNIDLSKLGRCWGMVDTTRKLVWFFYPVAGGNVNAGIVISTDQGFPWPAWPITLPRGWNFSCGRDIFLNNDITIGQVGAMDEYGDDVTLSSFESGQKAILVGRETGVFYTQKWDDNGDYSDSGLPINVHVRTGWTTPGQVEIYSADDLYHIFSSPDPEQKLEVRLRAQQVGQNIITRGPRDLWAGKPRRRTRHRLSGVQFAVDIRGKINRMFNWGGALMTITRGGARG